jgi:hypothetical protein
MLLEVFKTIISTCGPYNLGGFAIAWLHTMAKRSHQSWRGQRGAMGTVAWLRGAGTGMGSDACDDGLSWWAAGSQCGPG